jgi:hypothetical protein
MWNQKELLWLLIFAYVGFAQWASTWWSKLPLCILVSEEQTADNDTDQQTCATLFEGIVRLFRFLWERTNHENVSALATVLIAIFTLTLWRSTKRLWQASDNQLNLARTEFLSTHRPQIRIKHVWLIGDKPITVRVVCVNYGTTDAVIIDYGIEYLAVAEGRRPPPDKKIEPIRVDLSLPSGVSLELPDFFATFTANQEFGIGQRKANLYCMGYVHYRDGVGRLRTTAFCRVLKFDPVHGTGFFGSAGEPDYEYED